MSIEDFELILEELEDDGLNFENWKLARRPPASPSNNG